MFAKNKANYKTLALILAFAVLLGAAPISAAGAALAQTNKVFHSRVFIMADNAWIGIEDNDSQGTKQALELRTRFDLFFKMIW